MPRNGELSTDVRQLRSDSCGLADKIMFIHRT